MDTWIDGIKDKVGTQVLYTVEEKRSSKGKWKSVMGDKTFPSLRDAVETLDELEWYARNRRGAGVPLSQHQQEFVNFTITKDTSQADIDRHIKRTQDAFEKMKKAKPTPEPKRPTWPQYRIVSRTIEVGPWDSVNGDVFSSAIKAYEKEVGHELGKGD